jgi:hypothetical protein
MVTATHREKPSLSSERSSEPSFTADTKRCGSENKALDGHLLAGGGMAVPHRQNKAIAKHADLPVVRSPGAGTGTKLDISGLGYAPSVKRHAIDIQADSGRLSANPRADPREQSADEVYRGVDLERPLRRSGIKIQLLIDRAVQLLQCIPHGLRQFEPTVCRLQTP